MHITDIHPNHGRNSLGAAAFANDIGGCVAHAGDIAIIARNTQAKNAIIARYSCCEMRNHQAMMIQWLKQGLKKPHKTQAGLAAALNVDPSAISKIISGTRQIKAHELPKIAEYIGEPIPPEIGVATRKSENSEDCLADITPKSILSAAYDKASPELKAALMGLAHQILDHDERKKARRAARKS